MSYIIIYSHTQGKRGATAWAGHQSTADFVIHFNECSIAAIFNK